MAKIICKSESVFQQSLTKGKSYNFIEKNSNLFKIKGDNNRVRWFPQYCFETNNNSIPILKIIAIDDSIEESANNIIEVTIELPNGERRWCYFATPTALTQYGEEIEGSKLRFHYSNKHLIISNELSEEFIEKILIHIDKQGLLCECTLPL